MTEEEISTAADLYRGGMVLAEVRKRLRELGYKSRSVNTIRAILPQHGCEMRRPGRRNGRRA